MENKRSIGIQSIVPFRDQINPKIVSNFPLEELDYPKLILVPYTLSSLILTCSVIFIITFYSPFQNVIFANTTFDSSTEKEILKLILFYLKCVFYFIVILGVTYFPDSLMRRPHPVFWRFLYSVGIFYCFVLLLLCIVHADDARYILKIFDDKLNTQLAYKSYGENCSILIKEYPFIDLSEIIKSIDIYVLAHFVGWFVKYLAIRNIWLAMFMSIFFELLEITFEHWLNNFIECWWDHLLLDVFGMNLLGIIIGYLTVRYFNMKSYKWLEIQEKNKYLQCSEKNFLKYFFPSHTDVYEWDMLSSSTNFFGVLWFIIIFSLCDLGHFFLKFVLWLPITHYLLAIRIFMWGFLCIMAIREYYEYLKNKNSKRLGHFLWLSHVMLFLEWMIIIKIAVTKDMFKEKFPNEIKYSWIITFFVLGLMGIKVLITDIKKLLIQKKVKEKVEEDN